MLPKGLPNVLGGNVAIGLHDPTKGTNIAQNETLLVSEGLTSDLHGRAINRFNVALLTVSLEHDRTTTEGVGNQTVRARLGIAALDGNDLLGTLDVPGFTAATGLETRVL